MTNRIELAGIAELAPLFDRGIPLEQRLAWAGELRRSRASAAEEMDKVLLTRYSEQDAAIGELRKLLEKAKQLTAKLTAPPLREGVFVAPAPLQDGRVLARCVTGTQELLLSVSDDALLAELACGDRVYLSAEGNAVLGKSNVRRDDPGECASVERWIDAKRLLIRHRDQSIVVQAAAALTQANAKPGDSVRLDRMSGLAVERVDKDEIRRYGATEQATSLPPEALAGYDDIRDDVLRQVTYCIVHPQTAALYGIEHEHPWILLSGPPGNGKTTAARVIGGEIQRLTARNCRILKVNGGELQSPYVGETEARIKAVLNEAHDPEELTVLFIDEVDAIAPARGSSGNVHTDRFLGTWLAELEGFEGRKSFVLIAATNRLDMLDPAFRSRFATEIEIARPRMASARAIFARHLRAEYRYHAGRGPAEVTRRDMIEAAVAKLYLPNAAGAAIATLRLRDGKTRTVTARDLVSGRLIEQICVHACRRAVQRHIDGDPSGLRLEDIDGALDAALDRMRATLTPCNAHSYITDLPLDLAVIAVDAQPRARSAATYLREVSR